MTLLLKLSGLSLAALALSVAMSLSPSFANEYSRGSLYCHDFQEAEEYYQEEPDDKYYAAGYVLCLFARGQGNDNALAMDIAENTATRFSDVDTAWQYARFISTGGTFEKYDMSKLNESIEAFARVWLFINETPHYPMGYSYTEPQEQWTLYTIHSLVFSTTIVFFSVWVAPTTTRKFNLPAMRRKQSNLNFGPGIRTIPFTVWSKSSTRAVSVPTFPGETTLIASFTTSSPSIVD